MSTYRREVWKGVIGIAALWGMIIYAVYRFSIMKNGQPELRIIAILPILAIITIAAIFNGTKTRHLAAEVWFIVAVCGVLVILIGLVTSVITKDLHILPAFGLMLTVLGIFTSHFSSFPDHSRTT